MGNLLTSKTKLKNLKESKVLFSKKFTDVAIQDSRINPIYDSKIDQINTKLNLLFKNLNELTKKVEDLKNSKIEEKENYLEKKNKEDFKFNKDKDFDGIFLRKRISPDLKIGNNKSGSRKKKILKGKWKKDKLQKARDLRKVNKKSLN